MLCCVPNCNNNQSTSNTGATFHSFPLHPILRQQWAQALGLFYPQDTDRVCSDHFNIDSYDQYVDSERRLQLRLKGDAVPLRRHTLAPMTSITVKVCRVCLTAKPDLISLEERGLGQAYDFLVGVDFTAPLPPYICIECSHRLTAAVAFKRKAGRAKYTMANILNRIQGKPLTIDDITSQDRAEIKPTLGITTYSPNHYNFLIVEDKERQSMVKREIENVFVCDTHVGSKKGTSSNLVEVNIHIKEETDTLNVYPDLKINDIIPMKSSENVIDSDDEFFKMDANDTRDAENSLKNTLINNIVKYVPKETTKDRQTVIETSTINTVDKILSDSDDDFGLSNDDGPSCAENTVKNALINNISKYIIGRSPTKKLPRMKELRLPRLKDLKIPRMKDFLKAKKQKVESRKKVTESPRKKAETPHIKPEVKKKKPEIKRKTAESKRKRPEIARKGTKFTRRRFVEIDETVFSITALTFEEQLEDERRRKQAQVRSYRSSAYKCEVCGQRCASSKIFYVHMQKHDESLPFECSICKTRMRTQTALQHHVAVCHATKYQCKLCTFTTHHKTAALSHTDTHTGKQHPCRFCDMSFLRRATRDNHMRLKHPCAVACVHCGFTFRSERGLEHHRNRRHHGVDPSAPLSGPHCEECALTFASAEAYQRHYERSATHKDQRDVLSVCNSSQLAAAPPGPDRRRGPRDRAPRRPRAPEDRPKEFNRTAMCEHCGKVMDPKNLETHMWVHTGIKPFKCEICGKSFTQKQTVKKHIEYHHKGKSEPYVCRVCGDTFDYRGNLIRHTNTVHNGLKRFKCEICKKEFSTKKAKDDHVAHIHMNIPWPKRVRIRKNRNNMLMHDE